MRVCLGERRVKREEIKRAQLRKNPDRDARTEIDRVTVTRAALDYSAM